MVDLMRLRKLPALSRLIKGTTISSDGCWLYCGARVSKRAKHTRIEHDGIVELTHRFAYRMLVGPIPEGRQVLHTCIDNGNCWNPDHLYLGSNLDNVRDRVRQGRNRDQRGQKNSRTKLTDDIVRKIKFDVRSAAQIAAEYQVSRECIAHIKSGYSWNHI